MDMTKEIREEETMSGNIKTQRLKKGVIQQKQKIQINLKEKKSEPSLDNLKDTKITLPSSKSDDRSLSSMSKFSHENDKISREKK